MGLNKTKILGISITTSPKHEILEEVRKRLARGDKREVKPFVIVTPNPEQIVLAQNDTHFRNILNRADVAIPDGIGLVWASRILGRNELKKRIPGVELMENLLEIAAKEGYSIGLIGGWHGVAVGALERLQKKYPGLVGWAIEPEKISIQEISKRIVETNTRLLFVGLGAPKQEYFIERLSLSFRPKSRNPGKKTWIPGQARDDNKTIVLMAVGGSFDIIAGKTPRAPILLRSIGVEWLWRLFREPWRWKRQVALVKFLWLVLTRGEREN